jgi:hypothetical protein
MRITASSNSAASCCGTSPRSARSPAWSSPAGKGGTHVDERSSRRYADPYPQRPDARQVHRRDARLHAARLGARRALSEGYIRGYEKADDRQWPGRTGDQPEVLRRRAGDPRSSSACPSPAAACTWVSSDFPRSATAWASPSSPRPRASCPMQMHARPMLAAKCFAPCSEEGVKCLVSARNPSTLVKGTSASISGQTIEVKGPKGTRSFTAGDDVT